VSADGCAVDALDVIPMVLVTDGGYTGPMFGL
jgi:hypothetical protein